MLSSLSNYLRLSAGIGVDARAFELFPELFVGMKTSYKSLLLDFFAI